MSVLQSLLLLLNWILLYMMAFFSSLLTLYAGPIVLVCVCVLWKARATNGALFDCLIITRYNHQTGYIWVCLWLCICFKNRAINLQNFEWTPFLVKFNWAICWLATLPWRTPLLITVPLQQSFESDRTRSIGKSDAIDNSVQPLAFCTKHLKNSSKSSGSFIDFCIQIMAIYFYYSLQSHCFSKSDSSFIQCFAFQNKYKSEKLVSVLNCICWSDSSLAWMSVCVSFFILSHWMTIRWRDSQKSGRQMTHNRSTDISIDLMESFD